MAISAVAVGQKITAALVNSIITLVNTIQDSGWVTPTLGAGWTPEASNGVQYRKINGVVWMRGRAATAGTTTAIFTFPAGYLPDYPAGTASRGFDLRGASAATVSLTPAGALSLATGSTATNYDFLNVHFVGA